MLAPLNKRWLLLGLVLGLSSPALAQGTDEESAGGEEGEQDSGTTTQPSEATQALADRIPSVTRRAFEKEGRLELFLPTVGMSLNDPFFNHVISSAGFSFHVLESLAIGVTGDLFMSLESNVPVSGGENIDRPDFNRPLYAARLEVMWSPLYGKMSVLAETVLHLDVYLLAGGGVIGGQKGSPATLAVVGIGQHYFLNDWVAVRVELRDEFYSMSRNKAAPEKGKDLESLMSANVGVSLFIPPDFEREAL